MPPTRWKQEEEGKANHRQTLNSLTPSRLQMAPLTFLSRTAGLLLPFPRICKQPNFSITPWRSIAPKAEPGLPSDQCTLCPEHLPQAPPEHACPPPPQPLLLWEQAPIKLPYTAHLWGNLHRHLRVMAGAKGTLLGVSPARRNTLPLLTEKH